MTTNHHLEPVRVHPVLGCVAAVEAAVKDVAEVNPGFMTTADKKAALLGLGRLVDRVEELRLRVLATAEDVADDDGARDPAAWVTSRARRDRGGCRRRFRLAVSLDTRWLVVAKAVREGEVNLEQAEVIVAALEELPDDLDPEILGMAEERLVAEAATYGPRALRILGRRILDVVAPDVGEEQERRRLETEETEAARRCFVRTRRNGDGTTDIRARVADSVADRLLSYLEAYAAPRRAHRADHQGAEPSDAEPSHAEPSDAGTAAPSGGTAPDDHRSYDQRLGHAFGAFLESVDPARLPLHGGDATTVMVTIDLETLREALGTAGVAVVGDEPITAGQARRLACTANIVAVVLGGNSEILDLGRTRRLFSPAQRKAMAIRDITCRAEGCEIPAAWCEAHHAGTPWASGGNTDLAEGALLCSFHHHRAHDHRYHTRQTTQGRFSFHRRT